MTAARSYAARAPFDPDTLTAHIAAMQARIGHTTHNQPNDGPEGDRDDWLSDKDSDRAADADENRRWRNLP